MNKGEKRRVDKVVLRRDTMQLTSSEEQLMKWQGSRKKEMKQRVSELGDMLINCRGCCRSDKKDSKKNDSVCLCVDCYHELMSEMLLMM